MNTRERAIAPTSCPAQCHGRLATTRLGDDRLTRFLLLCFAVGALAVGCEHLDDDPTYTCDRSGEIQDASGTWTITGDGNRRLCDDDEWDGPFELRLGRPWIVTQSGSRLIIDPQLAANASFEITSASVAGACATIDAFEHVTLPDGTRTRLDWEFEVLLDGTNTLRGNLRGSGPEDCRVRGDLSVRVHGLGGF